MNDYNVTPLNIFRVIQTFLKLYSTIKFTIKQHYVGIHICPKEFWLGFSPSQSDSSIPVLSNIQFSQLIIISQLTIPTLFMVYPFLKLRVFIVCDYIGTITSAYLLCVWTTFFFLFPWLVSPDKMKKACTKGADLQLTCIRHIHYIRIVYNIILQKYSNAERLL